VQLGYAYRLDPTPGQRQALSRAFGCAWVVFNDAVAARCAAREAGAPYPTDASLSKALTAAKRTPGRAWLAEVSAVVLQQARALFEAHARRLADEVAALELRRTHLEMKVRYRSAREVGDLDKAARIADELRPVIRRLHPEEDPS
jgi:hypothetical protein